MAEGSVLCLAQLFAKPDEANGPDPVSEEYRERVLMALSRGAWAFAAEQGTVAFMVEGGRIFTQRHPDHEAVILFDVYPNGSTIRGQFWMNESSVVDEIRAARNGAGRRLSLEYIMTHDSPVGEVPLGYER